MQVFRARWLVPVDRPPIENGAMVVERGRIVDVGPASTVEGPGAVCDLGDLSAGLCVKGLKTFTSFVRKHPIYRAQRPWTEIMFVDGDQLSRVNFALNSATRHNYIYIHANSELVEVEAHLMKFGSESKH